MAGIIFDNSTLTAIQRLTGKAPASKYYEAQGDYSALELFLTHLMFYDDFYFIDDYKEEFRGARKSQFSYCRAVSPEMFDYETVIHKAKELTYDLMLDIRAGKVQPGLVKEFLDSIGLHLTGAWHMRSSNFFLVLKVLANGGRELREKYSPLTSMIFRQITGKEINENIDDQVHLLGTDGALIDRDISDEVVSFARSLNWLTLRAAFYTLLSGSFDVAVCLHPIRHSFVARWSERRNILSTNSAWRQNLTFFLGLKRPRQ